jgi:uncharacterized protein (DUF305 family)
MGSRRAFLAGAAAVVAPAGAPAQHDQGHPGVLGHTEHPGFAFEMHREMQAMMTAMDAAPMSGDADRDFLAMMIPHHQGAVDMARLLLVHGRDPLTRQLAEEIIASQQSEITAMVQRLNKLSKVGPSTSEEFPAISGTRGP